MRYDEALLSCIWGYRMNFLKKKNKASFVFFIIVLYSCIGTAVGFLFIDYLM